ncbi:hypothetical protein AOG28_07105 [Cobetia sp. UCD-24C]|nr:hypothetical protein AOG28_07105 [Cobetia sp. UCD-24C]
MHGLKLSKLIRQVAVPLTDTAAIGVGNMIKSKLITSLGKCTYGVSFLDIHVVGIQQHLELGAADILNKLAALRRGIDKMRLVAIENFIDQGHIAFGGVLT